MSARIVLHCQRCGAETDPENSREAVCHLCVGRELIAPLVSEMERLLRKKLRYNRRGTDTNDETLIRVTNRARRRLFEVLMPQKGEPVLQNLCAEVGERIQRELSTGNRIQRALPGDVVRVARAREVASQVLARV